MSNSSCIYANSKRHLLIFSPYLEVRANHRGVKKTTALLLTWSCAIASSNRSCVSHHIKQMTWENKKKVLHDISYLVFLFISFDELHDYVFALHFHTADWEHGPYNMNVSFETLPTGHSIKQKKKTSSIIYKHTLCSCTCFLFFSS